jgi:TolB protein
VRIVVLVLAAVSLLAGACPPARAACNPLTDPFTIAQLTTTGDFPAWSPDGSHLAYIEGEPGPVMEMELTTGQTRCLTCHFDNPGFLSVAYMADGSLILTGPATTQSQAVVDRFIRAELFWMSAAPDAVAQPLEQILWEHVAASRTSSKISWSITFVTDPVGLAPPREPTTDLDHEMFRSQLWTGEVVVTNGEAALVDRQNVLERSGTFEPQDFFPGDTRLLWTEYTSPDRRQFWEPGSGRTAIPIDADGEGLGIDLASKAIVNYTNNTAFDEPEGMFPGGMYTLLESDRDTGEGAFGRIDLYVLELDGTGTHIRRLTEFANEPNRKAHQGVVSPDGRHVAMTKGVVGDFGPAPDPRHPTGASDGLYMLTFDCV